MLMVNNLSLVYGKRTLFNEVNLKLAPGNCYGLIGANGAGKSTFVKILAGDIIPTEGVVTCDPNERIAVLRQDQFAYDSNRVLDVVIMGHRRLYDLMAERDRIYADPNFSDEDGMRVADIETQLAELNVWEAESEAGILLNALGIKDEMHEKQMGDLEAGFKVRVLLAQALYGNPDILLLDEPTNNLDLTSIMWLEEFLINFQNTVVVVSHDRHFLNKVCTHILDIDFGKINAYVGNYEFWYSASQLMLQQRNDKNKKNADKAADLKAFIARFSSNASKARQATSRKKLLEKLTPEEIPISSRKAPYIIFKPEREAGRSLLSVEGLTKSVDGELILNKLSFTVGKGDKIAFIGRNDLIKSTLFDILMGEQQADSGSFEWGGTVKTAYFPKENGAFFKSKLNMIEWLRQYTTNEEITFVRGFLGRMLFSGEEALKSVDVLSGGERVRCMLSRMMLTNGNFLILDEPTNHLDLESITALNNALIEFNDSILFASHDHQFVDTIANRILEITPKGLIDKRMSFDEYILDPVVQELRRELYEGEVVL